MDDIPMKRNRRSGGRSARKLKGQHHYQIT